ncbi:hypothetical protein [Xanthomonas phage JGB6]|nr:hypothetical protein [Xanthomonas phage JGB6]
MRLTMTTRTSKTNRNLGTVNGWGIATVNENGVELVATANGRMAIRALKRSSFPGGEFKVVQIAAKLTHYVK